MLRSYLNSTRTVVKPVRVGYIIRMQRQRIARTLNTPGLVFNSSRRGAPFLPGLLLMLLAVVVLVAPKLVFGAIAVVLFAVGILLCYVAYRIVRFKRQLREMAKNFEAQFSKHDFPMDKPDIDITDLDAKKVVFH